MAPHRRLLEEARGGVFMHVITYATFIVEDSYKSLISFGPTLVALLMKKAFLKLASFKGLLDESKLEELAGWFEFAARA
ncbi:hypothetical protein ACLB2K_061371 [Fragaria x ananassa]